MPLALNQELLTKQIKKATMKLQILQRLIPIACLLVSMNVLAYDFESGGIYYNITSSKNKTIEVTNNGLNSYTGDVSIPSSVMHEETTYIVTSIGKRAFYNSDNLISITIPNSITSIGLDAFSSCTGLTSIIIPNSVTSLGAGAFNDCTSLKYLRVEDGTEDLKLGYNSYTSTGRGKGLFYDCPLETLYLGRGIDYPTDAYAFPEKYGYSAFYNKSTMKTITIGNCVTSINPYEFQNCTSLTSITMGNNVTSIRKRAFYNCRSITSIIIPNSVTAIGDQVFELCTSLKDLRVEDGTKDLNLGYNYYKSTGTGESLFYDCPLETVYLGRNLSYQSDYSHGFSPFYDKKTLKTITIGNCVTSISKSAFYDCSSLTSITIGDSLTSIGEHAFRGCSGITEITIPVKVTSIGEYAFYNCNKLATVTAERETPATAYATSFKGLPTNAVLYVPSVESVDVYEAATGWNIFTTILPPFSLGDINCDGEVNVTDVVKLYSYILGHTTDIEESIVDLNDDGEVNVSDIVKLYSIILSSN